MVKPDFLQNSGSNQEYFTARRRELAVQWIARTRCALNYHGHTLGLAVLYFDRCLTAHNFKKGKAELLYGTCLYMAAKFFEMWPGPPKEEIREHMKSQPSDKAMFLMEWRVLELLEGELCVSSLFDFVRRGVKNEPLEVRAYVEHMAMLALMDVSLCHAKPSEIVECLILVAKAAHESD